MRSFVEKNQQRTRRVDATPTAGRHGPARPARPAERARRGDDGRPRRLAARARRGRRRPLSSSAATGRRSRPARTSPKWRTHRDRHGLGARVDSGSRPRGEDARRRRLGLLPRRRLRARDEVRPDRRLQTRPSASPRRRSASCRARRHAASPALEGAGDGHEPHGRAASAARHSPPVVAAWSRRGLAEEARRVARRSRREARWRQAREGSGRPRPRGPPPSGWTTRAGALPRVRFRGCEEGIAAFLEKRLPSSRGADLYRDRVGKN